MTTHQKRKTTRPRKAERAKDEAPDGMIRGDILTKEDIAALLKVARRTIENWQHEGHLPFIKVKNVVLFHWPTVLAHLMEHYGVIPRAKSEPPHVGSYIKQKATC
jgi:excisionase family DNA binding protein